MSYYVWTAAWGGGSTTAVAAAALSSPHAVAWSAAAPQYDLASYSQFAAKLSYDVLPEGMSSSTPSIGPMSSQLAQVTSTLVPAAAYSAAAVGDGHREELKLLTAGWIRDLKTHLAFHFLDLVLLAFRFREVLSLS